MGLDKGFDGSSLKYEREVGNGLGQLALMRCEQDGFACGALVFEQIEHLVGAGGVHVREGFVEKEQVRLWKQNAGERCTLAHALRVLSHGPRERRVKTDSAQGGFGCEARLLAVESGEVAEIFNGGKLVIEHGCVAHIPDAVSGIGGSGFAEDADSAVGGTEQSGNDAQEGGFAGAIFSEQEIAAAGLKFERDFSQRDEASIELREGFKLNNGGHSKRQGKG